VREVSPGHEDEETAEHAQHEPGRNRDMNRSHHGVLARTEARSSNPPRELDEREGQPHEDAGQREDVSTRLRGVGIAKGHAATASFSGRLRRAVRSRYKEQGQPDSKGSA